MSRGEDERSLAKVVGDALRQWLGAVRPSVMGSQPIDPTRIYAHQDQWDRSVETILTEIGKIGLSAWTSASDAPPVSRHAFVVSYLADVRSLLVRLPDEVANLVFAEITEGVNSGESRDQIAARVDRVLSYTGSEKWPNRAKVIAQTEVNRAYGAGTMAAGIEQARVTGRQLRKVWNARDDSRVRMPHHQADGQTVPVWQPFQVNGESLMFPGDPTGSPENVINCRCSIRITDA